MLHACVQRFDVIKNFIKFWNFESKGYVYRDAESTSTSYAKAAKQSYVKEREKVPARLFWGWSRCRNKKFNNAGWQCACHCSRKYAHAMWIQDNYKATLIPVIICQSKKSCSVQKEKKIKIVIMDGACMYWCKCNLCFFL